MDDLIYSLFDETEFKPPRRTDKSELVIRGPYKNKLSREQISFNKLTRKIDKLRNDIETRRAQLEKILLAWNAAVPDLLKTFSAKQLELVKYLDQSTLRFKYGKAQEGKLGTMILELLTEASRYINLDEESVAVYERWSGSSFEDDRHEAFARARDLYKERIRKVFGIDIDLSQYDESDESFARFSRELEERMAHSEFENPPGRKKTKKQIEAEQRLNMEEHRRKLSLRSVYLGLVKVLHPDIAADAQERKRRDDLMKQVTVAYKEGDLQALLRLEMTEVQRDVDTLDTLPTETLGVYIASLKLQVAQLTMELRDLYMHPRYRPISIHTIYGVDHADSMLAEQVEDCRFNITEYDALLSVLNEMTPKRVIMRIIDDYLTSDTD